MFYCAHDPGLALLLAEQDDSADQTSASPSLVRAIMVSILALNAAALAITAFL